MRQKLVHNEALGAMAWKVHNLRDVWEPGLWFVRCDRRCIIDTLVVRESTTGETRWVFLCLFGRFAIAKVDYENAKNEFWSSAVITEGNETEKIWLSAGVRLRKSKVNCVVDKKYSACIDVL